MLGVYIWCILLLFIAACILPWWFIPSCVAIALITFFIDYKTNKI